jgi:hypothetical protein
MRRKSEILAVTLLTGIVVALAMALSHARAEATAAAVECAPRQVC